MSVLLLLLLLSEPAQPVELEERVAVRAALPDDEDVAAFSTTVVLDDARARGAELADVLRRVPGARVRDYGGFGRFATVTLRGSTAEQVTVLVDGVPQNRSLGGPVDLSAIPLSQVEEVHIFRGFAPAALGLGGIGGVIDVRVRRTEELPDGRAARTRARLVAATVEEVAATGSFTAELDSHPKTPRALV